MRLFFTKCTVIIRDKNAKLDQGYTVVHAKHIVDMRQ